jgi:polar amino acid transport system permease protein
MSHYAIGENRFRSPLVDITLYVVAVAAITWLLALSTRELGYHWQWYRVPRYLFAVENGQLTGGVLIAGLKVTLQITAVSLLLAFAIGLITALLRLSNSLVGRFVARIYLEVIRNTPLLVQLFFIYFVLGPIFEINAFASAVVALSLFEGAYASEIFRAGIVSIHRGQWEAAFSIGLNTRQTYRLIVLPQAIKRILPPLVSQAVSLVKDSALVSTIAIYDLTMQAQAIIAETFLVFEIWFTVAAMYFVVIIILSVGIYYLQKRFQADF